MSVPYMAEPATIQTLLTYLTLISVPVGVLYHIMTLRNQSRTRQAQMFMQLYQRTIDEESNRRWNQHMGLKWHDYDDYERKYGAKSDRPISLHTVWQQFNGVGLLLKRGLIDRETAYGLTGGWRAALIWLKWKDIIVEMRERWYNPDYMDGLEYLGVEMMTLREEKGFPNRLPPGFETGDQ